MSTYMFRVPLDEGPVEFRGALALEHTKDGLRPRRLPAWTREQYPDSFMDFVTMMPSGVRLAFRTAARSLELELLTTVRHFDGRPGPAPAGYIDLVVNGRLAERAPVPVGDVLHLAHSRAPGALVPGEPGTMRFAELPDGVKEIELWLPQQTPCVLRALRADAEVSAPAPSGRRRWVHHGSSISHCTQADGPTGTWPAVASRLSEVEVTNLGMAGNAMMDPYVARTIRDSPADLISLELGANPVGKATFKLRTFIPAVHGWLDTIRDGHPDTPLLVMSPIIIPLAETADSGGRPPAEDGPDSPLAFGDPGETGLGPLTVPQVRRALERIVGDRRRHDPRLHHLDGRRLFGAQDIADLLPDQLHPNGAGYRRMGERFAAIAFGSGGAFR